MMVYNVRVVVEVPVEAENPTAAGEAACDLVEAWVPEDQKERTSVKWLTAKPPLGPVRNLD